MAKPPVNRSADPAGQKIRIKDLSPPVRDRIAALEGDTHAPGTGGAVSSFNDLDDVPASYTGQAGKYPKVKATEDGLEYASLSGGGDMAKATYDTDDDGRVDVAEGINDGTNSATAANIKDAVDKKHAANGDTDLDATFEATFVKKADFNANTILAANSDDTPAALEITEQTVVGRITGGNIAALSVSQLITLVLSAALPENVAIKLDVALSADGKYSAVAVEVGTLGETVAFGECVYFKAADSQWYKAKADAEATLKPKIGICLVAGNDNDATVILLIGKVRADAVFPSFTVGAPVFISAATAGALTNTAPSTSGQFIRCVGEANTADELWFDPDKCWGEVS